MLEPGPEQEAFMDTLRLDLAVSLGVDISEVEISGVRAPSDGAGRRLQGEVVPSFARNTVASTARSPRVVVAAMVVPSQRPRQLQTGGVAVEFDFVINSDSVSTDELMRDLTEQLNNPDSPLMNGAATSALVSPHHKWARLTALHCCLIWTGSEFCRWHY